MLTKQEMFDRAVHGLYSQGYRRCMMENRTCVYTNGEMHCGYGWIDPGQPNCFATAYNLCSPMPLAKPGAVRGPVAQWLASLDAWEATDMRQLVAGIQGSHDNGDTPNDMRNALKFVGERHGLVWPQGC